MIRPSWPAVFALKFLQKSMMFTPWGPRAVPTGGAGVAAPAWSCTLTSAAIFFLGGICSSFSRVHYEGVLPSATGGACPSGQPGHCARPTASRRNRPVALSDLLDLGEAELDGGLAAEDLDQRLDA